MFKHLEGKNFEEGSKLRMHKAYSAICEASAYRNVNKYSEILRRMPSEQKFLSWWLLFDFYDMLPDGCRINSNSALLKRFRHRQRQLLPKRPLWCRLHLSLR